MLSTRLLSPLLGCMVINLNMTTCRSPGESDKAPPSTSQTAADVSLPGIDTKELTARERAQWSSHVTDLLAPCESTPVGIKECVQTKRDCAACLPAARYLLNEVRQGRTKAQVELAYSGRFGADQVKSISLDGSPSKGATDAPITIVEFADFECPACRAASPLLDALVLKHPDLKLVFKNFPLDFHQNAEPAARAAMAADKQGKFWEMHKELFSSPEPLTAEHITALAKKVGLDLAQFDKDQRSEAVVDAVNRDKKQGREAQLKGTPSLFINGREFNYATDFGGELEQWLGLERELLGARKVPDAAPSKQPTRIADGDKVNPAAPAPATDKKPPSESGAPKTP